MVCFAVGGITLFTVDVKHWPERPDSALTVSETKNTESTKKENRQDFTNSVLETGDEIVLAVQCRVYEAARIYLRSKAP